MHYIPLQTKILEGNAEQLNSPGSAKNIKKQSNFGGIRKNIGDKISVEQRNIVLGVEDKLKTWQNYI